MSKFAKTLFISALCAAFLLVVSQPGLAQPKKNDERNQKPAAAQPENREQGSPGQPTSRQCQGWVKAKFGDRQDQRSQPGKSPTGIEHGVSRDQARQWAHSIKLSGYRSLPEPARKQMIIGGPMPPNVELRPVPVHMVSRLPVQPGYEWRAAGSDLVLLDAATLVIHDIFEHVFD